MRAHEEAYPAIRAFVDAGHAEPKYERDDYDRARRIGAAMVDLCEYGFATVDDAEIARAVRDAANVWTTPHQYVAHGTPGGSWVVHQAQGRLVGEEDS